MKEGDRSGGSYAQPLLRGPTRNTSSSFSRATMRTAYTFRAFTIQNEIDTDRMAPHAAGMWGRMI